MVKRLVLVAALLACVSPASHAQSPGVVAGPTIEDLIGLVDLGTVHGELALSPDGANIAVFERRANLTRNDYDYTLVLVPTPGGQPRAIADGGGSYVTLLKDGAPAALRTEPQPGRPTHNGWPSSPSAKAARKYGGRTLMEGAPNAWRRSMATCQI